MKISLKWLSEYIDLSDLKPEEISEKLTMCTCEVEGIESVFSHFQSIIIAEVIKKEKHSNSDHLSICQVNDGKQKLQVICGAPNVAEGQKIAFAPIGCTLPNNLEIKKAKLRGVDSFGMICSEKELGVSENAEGIWVLPENFQVGKKLSEYYDWSDTVLDIDNKSVTHRPDLWGHFGFARELSAILQRPLKYKPGEKDIKKAIIDDSLSCPVIEIVEDAAINYCGMVIENVKVEPSPLWLQGRLKAIGQKPINNLVDISNYVMFEIGQPNHAFDRTLVGDKIIIYKTKKPIKFTTLDEEKREIPAGSVMIADEKHDVALGGIMGGMNSEIKEDTNTLFLESANFPRTLIRGTLSKIALRTDAAIRFEKGLSPVQSEKAVRRFVELLEKCDLKIKVSKLNAKHKKAYKERTINFNPSMAGSRLGADLSNTAMKNILKRLYFTIEEKSKDAWKVLVPDFRSIYDISLPIDLVEEIGRIFGYGNINETAPLVPCTVSTQICPSVFFSRKSRETFAYKYNFTEVSLYSFISEDDVKQCSAKNETKYDTIELANPISPSMNLMRTTLIPGLIRAAIFNIDRYDSFRIFESGRIHFRNKSVKTKHSYDKNGVRQKSNINIRETFFGNKEEHIEEFVLGGVLLPAKVKNQRDENFKSFLELKAQICDFFSEYFLEKRLEFSSDSQLPIYLHPGLALNILLDGVAIGSVGLIHPKTAAHYGVKRDLILFEINQSKIWDSYEKLDKKYHNYKVPSVYPPVFFEFTIVVKQDASTKGVLESIYKLNINEIRSVNLINTYKGEPLADNEEALSYRVELVSDKTTLDSNTIMKIQNKIVETVTNAGYPLRS